MNYFPFHIGDYLSATRHLSWDEDCAYRRLLDTYYTTEKPLPVDVAKVCRLVLASSEVQRAAVQTVLDEFFRLTEAGWVNSRADDEIAAMREKVQAVEEKDGHEKTRKERYRERRAFLFAFLRERDEVPAYDIGMKELQEKATSCGWDGTFKSVPGVPAPSENTVPSAVPVERTGNVSGNETGTAIPIPTPTPTPKGEGPGKPDPVPGEKKRKDKTLATYLEECREAHTKPIPADHHVRAYARDAGISDEMVQVAWVVFKEGYTEDATKKFKRYTDWPGHFANAVKKNWGGLWYMQDGVLAWSSVGQLQKAALDARMKAKGAGNDAT